MILTREDYKNIAAKIEKGVMKTNKELEKEIAANYNPCDGLSFEDYSRIAKYFADWQREQMMRLLSLI